MRWVLRATEAEPSWCASVDGPAVGAGKEAEMDRLVKVVGVLSLAVWLGAGAPVRAVGDAASDVKAVDVNLYDAIATRDATRLGDLLDDGFVLTNTFGDVYDKEKFLSACCGAGSATNTVSLSATDTQIKTYGSAAVVVARTEMRFTKDSKDQKIAWRSTRTYVRSGSRWKLVAEQRTTVN
jgi:ketosteroid isomerase-like protein